MDRKDSVQEWLNMGGRLLRSLGVRIATGLTCSLPSSRFRAGQFQLHYSFFISAQLNFLKFKQEVCPKIPKTTLATVWLRYNITLYVDSLIHEFMISIITNIDCVAYNLFAD